MDRRVERSLIDSYIEKYSLSELERLSDVSSSTWSQARCGRVPKKFRTRRKMFSALKVSEDELFPLAPTRGKARAS